MTQYKQITSVKDATNEKPWYDIQINSGRPEIATDNDGGTNFDMSGVAASTPAWSSLSSPPAKAMQKDAVYGVTNTGEFIAWEKGKDLSEEGISLRAHLTWYDSATDEFTVLDFVEK